MVVSTLCVLGSGGHTTEICKLVSTLANNYDLSFVCAVSDVTSESRVRRMSFFKRKHEWQKPPKFYRVRRPREVGQGYFSSILTTFRSFLDAFMVLRSWISSSASSSSSSSASSSSSSNNNKKYLLLANGPSTALPIIYLAFVLSRVPGCPKIEVIYVESWCRVKTISLTGRLCEKVVDKFVRQWNKGKGGVYLGKVC